MIKSLGFRRAAGGASDDDRQGGVHFQSVDPGGNDHRPAVAVQGVGRLDIEDRGLRRRLVGRLRQGLAQRGPLGLGVEDNAVDRARYCGPERAVTRQIFGVRLIDPG
ncbi:hypothetical protein D3C80_1826960 [compost metagenome]